MIWQRKKPAEFSDVALIEGCMKGEEKYQELLYKRFFSFAMSVALRYTPEQSQAMEIVNDAFIKFFDRIDSFDTERPFKTWIARIVVNTAIDNYRRNLRHTSMLRNEEEMNLDAVEGDVEHELGVKDILKLFEGLPEIYRVTFNLYEIEGYSHLEIGDMLRVPPSTSRTNLTRAKRMLRALYNRQFKVVAGKYE